MKTNSKQTIDLASQYKTMKQTRKQKSESEELFEKQGYADLTLRLRSIKGQIDQLSLIKMKHFFLFYKSPYIEHEVTSYRKKIFADNICDKS